MVGATPARRMPVPYFWGQGPVCRTAGIPYLGMNPARDALDVPEVVAVAGVGA